MADKRPIETVEGLVLEEKKPFWKRVYDMIFAESIEDVRKDVAKHVIGPYIKDFFCDLFTEAVQRSIYGSGKSNYSLRGSARNLVRNRVGEASYEQYYKRSQPKSESDELYEPVVMDSRAKAERVIMILQARIAEYGEATINELNDCLKRIGKFTDEYYGWKDLSGANVRKLGLDEYQVILPEPIQLTKKGRPYTYEV